MAFWKAGLGVSNQVFYIENIWGVLVFGWMATSEGSFPELSWDVSGLWLLAITMLLLGDASFEVLPLNRRQPQEGVLSFSFLLAFQLFLFSAQPRLSVEASMIGFLNQFFWWPKLGRDFFSSLDAFA